VLTEATEQRATRDLVASQAHRPVWVQEMAVAE
jgi:hypothetical protein